MRAASCRCRARAHRGASVFTIVQKVHKVPNVLCIVFGNLASIFCIALAVYGSRRSIASSCIGQRQLGECKVCGTCTRQSVSSALRELDATAIDVNRKAA